jgi:hypothetical protein
LDQHQDSFGRVPNKEVGADLQNILVTFSHVHGIVMHTKVILVMREPDVEKAYPRIQLSGNVQVLGLGKVQWSVNAGGIMGSGNAQRRHRHIVRNVSHPRTMGNELIRRVFLAVRRIRARSRLHFVGELAGNVRGLTPQPLDRLNDLISQAHG